MLMISAVRYIICGNFYFLYGKNADGKYEYGGLPNYEMAKDNGVVNVLYKDANS